MLKNKGKIKKQGQKVKEKRTKNSAKNETCKFIRVSTYVIDPSSKSSHDFGCLIISTWKKIWTFRGQLPPFHPVPWRNLRRFNLKLPKFLVVWLLVTRLGENPKMQRLVKKMSKSLLGTKKRIANKKRERQAQEGSRWRNQVYIEVVSRPLLK